MWDIYTLNTHLFLGHFGADDLTDEILLLYCERNGWKCKYFVVYYGKWVVFGFVYSVNGDEEG